MQVIHTNFIFLWSCLKTEQTNEMKDDYQHCEMQAIEDSTKHKSGTKHRTYAAGFKSFKVFTINVACVNKKLTRVYKHRKTSILLRQQYRQASTNKLLGSLTESKPSKVLK